MEIKEIEGEMVDGVNMFTGLLEVVFQEVLLELE